ncbi:hypothetical protein [Nostoc sp.]|uniref:hypothetical protein n=1 Tax=Nostoc sp. TaxID=1180 RepID=UPI002FF88DF5
MKTSLVKAFRYCLVPSLRLGMLVIEAPPQHLRQSRQYQHFQPEAGNEVLKEFQLNLTPMSNAVPLLCGLLFSHSLDIK